MRKHFFAHLTSNSGMEPHLTIMRCYQTRASQNAKYLVFEKWIGSFVVIVIGVFLTFLAYSI
jgi:hypothetical protein